MTAFFTRVTGCKRLTICLKSRPAKGQAKCDALFCVTPSVTLCVTPYSAVTLIVIQTVTHATQKINFFCWGKS